MIDSSPELFNPHESRYRAIFENSIMGIVIIDSDLLMREINTVFAKITGFEVAKLSNTNFMNLIHPVETKNVETLLKRILKLTDGKMTTQEMQLISFDGTIKTVISYISCYFDDRLEQNVLIAILDDISEKKKIAEELIRSEQKHRMIAEYVLDVIWIADLNMVHSFVSPSIYQFQGYEQAEFLNIPLEQSLTPESLQIVKQKMADCYRVILSGEQKAADLKATMEIVYKHKNGSLVHGEATAAFIIDSKGNPTGILGVTRDISARKRHEKDLLTAMDKAEEANRLKSMFLANVSHEIRTPVSGIIGVTSRLIQRAPDPFFQNQLKSILNSAEMLLTIINDLLDISRIEAGKLDLECIEFDFRQMLSGVTDLFTHKIQEKKLYFHYAIDESIPQHIKGDPVRIGQILINILGNAIKFTNIGGIELSVAGITRGSKKKSGIIGIKFSVKDTGQGIPQDKIAMIFNAFTQADISHTRKFGGTGLGLTIAAKLIEKMDGQIRVKSKVGHGSLFEYELYLQKVVFENNSESYNLEQPVNKPHSLTGLSILIGEDNDLNAEYLKMLLEDFGVRAVICSNGQQALESFLGNQRFDGIILDIQMPVMDGYQTARAIRQSNSPDNKIPILGLSASGFPDEEKMVFESGMNQFMIKPAKEEKLLNWLYSLTGEKTEETVSITGCQNPQNDLDIEDLLNKNNQRLSSLLPLVKLMLDTGRSYINELFSCWQDKKKSEFKISAHKFRGRVGVFNSNILNDHLIWLESNFGIAADADFSARLEQLKSSYDCFEAKLENCKDLLEKTQLKTE